LIGATTRVSVLSSPLRDRFGLTFRLDYYKPEDIEQIILRSSSILGIPLDHTAAKAIAQRSRRTPRVANRLLKRVRDYAEVKGDGSITPKLAEQALDALSIDKVGLDDIDRRILETIIERYQGGPVGLGSIAAAVSEEEETLEDVYEPFLLQIGFLSRTQRGRIVTPAGYKHLGRRPPSPIQSGTGQRLDL
jgi:Holliday junction DNA helicase RuvB